MAKKNDSIHPIFLIIALFAFILIKIFEFLIDNITTILVILGVAFGVFIIYSIINQSKYGKAKNDYSDKLKQQKNIPTHSKYIANKPKTITSNELITDIYKVKIQTNNERIIKNKLVDETIIDLKNEKLDLRIEEKVTESNSETEVPSWSQFYVYSFDDIRYASIQQRKFYFHLKKNLLQGNLIDIQGNTNYAFILYFDLLNEYEKHKNIKLLEEQFKLIGLICPKTKNYTLQLLIDELKKRKDSYSIEKLKELENPLYRFENGYTDYNPYQNRLGSLFKDQLNLNKKEVEWLNKIWHITNVFLSIDKCLIEVIRQYNFVLKELENKWNTNEISNNITDLIKNELIRKQDYFDSFESDVYLSIFKKVENVVREAYGHNRKIPEDVLLKYSTRVQSKFEKLIGEEIDGILITLKNNISYPDKSTQIELNAQNINRWKIEYNALKDKYQTNHKNKFIDGMIHLEETNQKNNNIEIIFFEASKFIAKYDKVQALKYYTKYIYYDLKSKKFDNLQLNTTIQKSLFDTNEQLNDFHSVIEKLIKNANLDEALAEISNIYTPKRKKIVLDKLEIKAVEKKHIGTVELLNGILVNESEEFEVDPIESDNTNEELEVSFGIKINNIGLFKPNINLNKVQEQLVQRIVKNSFSIHQEEVEDFALDNGLFKNQLIDSINEICAEILDGEALIEEDDDNYIIDESYYLEIVN